MPTTPTGTASPETTPRTGTDGVEQRWRFEADGRVRPLAVANGLVYATTNQLHAIDVETGRERWRSQGRDGTVDGDTACVGYTRVENSRSTPGTTIVDALDARDGSTRWQVELDGRLALDAGPVTGGELVVAGVSEHEYPDREVEDPFDRVVGLDAADGSERWRTELFPESPGEPVDFLTVVDDIVYVGTRAHTIHALDAADGSERWVTKLGEIGAIDADGRHVAAATGRSVHVLDRADGRVIHRIVTGFHPGVAARGGTVFAAATDGTVTATDPADASVEWRTAFEGDIEDISVFAPAATDTVYVSITRPARTQSSGDDDSTLYALDARTGRERWRFTLRSAGFFEPVVTDDRVFVGSSVSDSSLYALEPLAT